jgi:putative FmdB family regulatory protein
MPLYSYECPTCDHVEEALRTVAERHADLMCPKCSAGMVKQFASPHLDILEPYFDEGLGCDVHSASHRRKVMKQQGVIEAGDRVGGAINFDRHAPHHVGKFPQRGIEYAQPVHRDQPVEIVDSAGKTVEKTMFSELKGY